MLHHSQISLDPHSFCELSKINDLRHLLKGAAQLVTNIYIYIFFFQLIFELVAKAQIVSKWVIR